MFLVLHPHYELMYIKLAWGGPDGQWCKHEARNPYAKDWHDKALKIIECILEDYFEDVWGSSLSLVLPTTSTSSVIETLESEFDCHHCMLIQQSSHNDRGGWKVVSISQWSTCWHGEGNRHHWMLGYTWKDLSDSCTHHWGCVCNSCHISSLQAPLFCWLWNHNWPLLSSWQWLIQEVTNNEACLEPVDQRRGHTEFARCWGDPDECVQGDLLVGQGGRWPLRWNSCHLVYYILFKAMVVQPVDLKTGFNWVACCYWWCDKPDW